MILNAQLSFGAFSLGFLFFSASSFMPASSFISAFSFCFCFDFALAFFEASPSSSRTWFFRSWSSISKSSSTAASSSSASSAPASSKSFVACALPRPLPPRPLAPRPVLPRPLPYSLLPRPLPRLAFGFGCSLAAAAFRTLFCTSQYCNSSSYHKLAFNSCRHCSCRLRVEKTTSQMPPSRSPDSPWRYLLPAPLLHLQETC